MKTRKLIVFMLGISLSIAATACGAKHSTPTEAFKAFYDAGKKKDAEALKAVLSKNFLAFLEKVAKDAEMPLNDFLTMHEDFTEMPEFRNEKIDGDKATLEYKRSGYAWKTQDFVKEDGGWKLDATAHQR